MRHNHDDDDDDDETDTPMKPASNSLEPADDPSPPNENENQHQKASSHTSVLVYKGQDLQDTDRNVSHIIIDPSVKELPNGCFAKFFNLVSVELHQNLTVIGEESFSFCRSLRSMEIPPSVWMIRYQAFVGSGLVEVHLSEGLEVIGRQAFQNCHKLQGIEFPATLEELGSGAFKACYKLSRIVWKSSKKMKMIPDYAFCMCHSLTSIMDIPSSVTELGDECFSNCVALTSIHLPVDLTRIGSGAFLQCIALRDVSFSFPSLDSIEMGDFVFNGCSHLDLALKRGV
jgi:hypothetical protein